MNDSFPDDEIIRHLNACDRGQIVYVGEGETGHIPHRAPHTDAAGRPQAAMTASALDDISPTTTAYDAWRMWQDAHAGTDHERPTSRTTHDISPWSAGYDAGYAEGWTARDISPFTDRPQGLE